MTSAAVKTSIAVALVGVVCVSTARAQAVRVAGTAVTLTPPDGFVPAAQFPGFQNAELQASIMVTEMAGAAAAMVAGMTKDALARQGVTLIASKVVIVDGKEAVLLHLRQAVGKTEFFKWMLVAGDQSTTVLVVGTFPGTAAGGLGDDMRRSVLTASRNTGASPDAFEGLLFRITPNDTLRIARRMSNMIMLNESGTTEPVGLEDAVYIAGNSLGEVGIGNVQAFAEARARKTARMKDVRNLTGRSIQVDGAEAYEIVCDAKDATTGTAMKLYQVLVPDVNGYFIVQGFISAARAADVLPEFQRMTGTFRIVRQR
jgi:hypothetical protein